MLITVSKFASLVEPKVTDELEFDWNGLTGWLTKKPLEAFRGKTEHTGWAPVKLEPDMRAIVNVVEVCALVLDYDTGASWNAVKEAWKDYKCVIYTTRSHGDPEKPGDRLRVVLQLARPVNVEEHARLWEWASRRSPSPLDKKARDASRFWYDPSEPPGGWRIEVIDGEKVVDVPEQRRTPPPAAVKAEGIERRAKAYLDKLPPAVSGESGHNTLWNAVAHMLVGFSLDPVVARRLIDEYSKRCVPPWSEREIDHKMKSVAERCNRTPGYLLRERGKPAESAAPAEDKHSADWKQGLLLKTDRSARRCVTNVSVVVSLHPEYYGRWTYDESAHIPCLDGKRLTPDDVLRVREFIERTLGFTPSREDVEAAIVSESGKIMVHPVREYLRSLDWDNVSRLSGAAEEYLGTKDPLHGEMFRRWMIGAAARALWPGCKMDTALMLIGRQGVGKSTFFSILGGTFHSDTFVDISNKDSFSQIHSAWIYELSELESVVTGRAESRLKAWITSTHDTFRAPYARTAERKPRSVVLCGTTNRKQFLTDDSGSRRFWILPMRKAIDRVALMSVRDQLWAEAMSAAESGEKYWLDADQEMARETGNKKHTEEDAWIEPIRKYLAVNNLSETCTHDLLKNALGIDVGKHDLSSSRRVGRVISFLGGWKRYHLNSPPWWVYRKNPGNP